MSRRAKKSDNPLTEDEITQRLRNLIQLGYIERASDMPPGAIPVATTIPANSWGSAPMPFYVDETYRCRDCGKQVTWTAKEKFQYYEVEKGNRYAQRVRCDSCHSKE